MRSGAEAYGNCAVCLYVCLSVIPSRILLLAENQALKLATQAFDQV